MLTVSVLPGRPPDSLGSARITQAWRDDGGHAYGRARVGPDGCWLEWDGLGVFRFLPPDSAVTAWAAPGISVGTLRDAFERFLQPIVLQALGHPVLHASGVLTPQGAVALCGVSGSGKSTIAYGLSRLGCTQLADDALVLSLSEDAAVIHPSPFSPRLRRSALDALDPVAGSPQPASPAHGHPRLSAIAILTQAPFLAETVRVDLLPEFQAFARVLAHAHSFDPESAGEAARLSREYLDLVSRVPVFDLTYRPDFSRLSEVLAAVLHMTSPHVPRPLVS